MCRIGSQLGSCALAAGLSAGLLMGHTAHAAQDEPNPIADRDAKASSETDTDDPRSVDLNSVIESLRDLDTRLVIRIPRPFQPVHGAAEDHGESRTNPALLRLDGTIPTASTQVPADFGWLDDRLWVIRTTDEWTSFLRGDRLDTLPISSEPAASGGPFRVEFGRDTTLLDGGFNTPTAPDEIGNPYVESPGERFERFNLDLEWTPMRGDAPIQWLVLSGVQAFRADISRIDDANLGIGAARGLVAIPTIGTGVRWQPTDGMTFSTTAATQSIDQNAGVVDFSFNAEFRLTPKIGLTAGYEFFQSDMVVDDLRTSLDREGVFAKITIRF